MSVFDLIAAVSEAVQNVQNNLPQSNEGNTAQQPVVYQDQTPQTQQGISTGINNNQNPKTQFEQAADEWNKSHNGLNPTPEDAEENRKYSDKKRRNVTTDYLANNPVIGNAIRNVIGEDEYQKILDRDTARQFDIDRNIINGDATNTPQGFNPITKSSLEGAYSSPLAQVIIPKEKREQRIDEAPAAEQAAKATKDEKKAIDNQSDKTPETGTASGKEGTESDKRGYLSSEGSTQGQVAPMTDDEFQKIFGISRADYDAYEQRDQFQKALEAEALKNYYQDTYGIGGEFGYEQWRDLGNTYDYSGKHDLVRDVLGLGDSQYAIPGWSELYGSTGIDMNRGENNERDEEIIQAVMDYMWGEDNIINLNDWTSDLANGGSGYSKAHNLGAEGAADMIAQYYLNNYAGDATTDNILSGFQNSGGLDNKDLAAWMMAQNLANKDANYFTNFGENNLGQLSAILGGAGDTASLMFADNNDNGGEEASIWSPQRVNVADVLNAVQKGETLPVYNDVGVENAIFSNVVDNIADTIEQRTGKKVKSSNKE